MLEALHRFVKSWVAKALLALLILSFAVWGIEGVFSGSTNPTIARVGSEQLDAQRLINAVIRQQNQISRQRQALISLAELRAAGVDEAALQAMIRDASFESELKSLQLAVPAEAVRENIRVNPAFLDGQGQFSQFAYQTRLTQEGFNPIEFEALTRTLLGQQILIGATTNADQYAPGVAEEMAKWRGERRGIRMITLPLDSAEDPGQPTDAELQTFFDANSDDFIEPDRRWGRFLHTDIAQLAERLAPTDDDIRAFFDADPSAFERTATRTLEQITFEDLASAKAAADRISAGEATFADIAADRDVAVDSLELGTVEEGDLPEATASAVFGVTEPGVVGPVEGPFNVVLLNVTALELGGIPDFDEISDQIRAQLLQDRLRGEVPELANRIDDLRAEGSTLDEIAEQTELPLKPFDGIAQNFTVEDGTFPTAAYDPRLMGEIMEAGEGDERDMIELADGSYALVWVDRIVDSHLPELDTIREKVTEAWQNDQRLASLEARAVTIASELASNAEGTEGGALWIDAIEPEAFSREDAPSTLSPQLVDAIFSGAEGGFVSGRNGRGEGVVVARIEAIEPLTDDALAEQQAELAQALQDSVARDHLEYFARAILDTHPASVNYEAIDRVFEQLGQATGGGY